MKHNKDMTLMIAQSIRMPLLPNYVRFADGGVVDVGQLTMRQLHAIGNAWKKAFVEHGQQRKRLGDKR